MPLSPILTEDAITARLATIVPRVYTTEVPDGVAPVYPYIVVYFGTPVRMARGRNLMSTRQDAMRGYCMIEVAAPTDAAARAVQGAVIESLTGYRPTNAGEMTLEGGAGGGYSRAATGTNPTVYYREVAYSWVTNLAWNA